MQYYLSFSLPSFFFFPYLIVFILACVVTILFTNRHACWIYFRTNCCSGDIPCMYMSLMTAANQATAEGFLVVELNSVPLLPVGKNELMFISLFCPWFECFFIHMSSLFSPNRFSSVLDEGRCIVWPAPGHSVLGKAISLPNYTYSNDLCKLFWILCFNGTGYSNLL